MTDDREPDEMYRVPPAKSAKEWLAEMRERLKSRPEDRETSREGDVK